MKIELEKILIEIKNYTINFFGLLSKQLSSPRLPSFHEDVLLRVELVQVGTDDGYGKHFSAFLQTLVHISLCC